MKNYKIFTVGEIAGIPYRRQMEWRDELETSLRNESDKSVTFIHLPMFYNNNSIKSKEARDWVINQIKDSDIVVVNLNSIENSVETLFELGIITTINNSSYKHINAVGIGNANINHPWIQLCVNHIEETIEETADYIINYLLV